MSWGYNKKTKEMEWHPESETMGVYPSCCTSKYCGRIECSRCRYEPVLKQFKTWRDEHDAIVSDPIWSPTIFTATK